MSVSRSEQGGGFLGPLQFSLAEGMFVLAILCAAFAVLGYSLTAGGLLLALLIPALGRTGLIAQRERDAGRVFPLWRTGITLVFSLLVCLVAESLMLVCSLGIGCGLLWLYALADPQFGWVGLPLVIALVVLLAIGGGIGIVWMVLVGTWPPRLDLAPPERTSSASLTATVPTADSPGGGEPAA
ncbi:MAG: hypothetical protein MUF06_20075 [Pirellulaceae bacterium]|jgi:hypothetical protein|nr:hypothetical protein [Pirellulaceae bacterium]